MPELKINKVEKKVDDVPSFDEVSVNEKPKATDKNTNDSFVKEEIVEKKKLFQNKKANIALIIVGSIVVLGFIAAAVIHFCF